MANIVKSTLNIENMTCAACELKISNTLKKLNGVLKVNVNFAKSQAEVSYDKQIVTLEKITVQVEKIGYSVISKITRIDEKQQDKMSINQLLGIGIILFALYLVIKNTIGFNFIPQINQSMGYGILFVVGLLTSVHCVAMCGGINLSQCVSYKCEGKNENAFSKLKPSLLYNLGRVISYTVIGGIVGALGAVFSFSGATKGIVVIVSGLFMLMMGLNMLNIFPWLRRFTPRMPKLFGNKIFNNNEKHGPFYVGLLNGLMPCGPLQAMQLYALGTGSFLAGATSMLVFSLGTVPLMFGLGAISSLLSSKFTHRLLKASAVLVMILGLIMINRGLNLSGISYAQVTNPKPSAISGNVAKIENGVQVITTNLKSNSYEPIVVQKGIPVKWTYTAKQSEINGCNETLTIPKYGIEKKLVAGDNLIEFTPSDEGVIPYTCWMGMIRSSIKVVADVKTTTPNVNNAQSLPSANPIPTGSGGGSCCGG